MPLTAQREGGEDSNTGQREGGRVRDGNTGVSRGGREVWLEGWQHNQVREG